MAAQLSSGARVDVLAVMQRDATDAARLRSQQDTAYALRRLSESDAARAAVAELAAKANKVAVWLGRSALIADTNAQDTRFPSLAEAFSADAKNYRAIEAELRAALAPFSEAGR